MTSSTNLRIFGTAVALAFAATALAPATLKATTARHQAVRHVSAPETEANGSPAESCWKITDPDHNYGYSVPCTREGAQHR